MPRADGPPSSLPKPDGASPFSKPGPKSLPRDFSEHVQPWQTEYLFQNPHIKRERPIQSLCYACRDTNYKWFVNDLENPYTQEKPFHWIRQRVLGGRSLSWGRQSYRMSDLDFKAASHDGYGDDWPISYDEMVPYYERVERYVGISGQSEGLPQLPDSVFLPPMEMTCGEGLDARPRQGKMGRTVTIGRVADSHKSAQRPRRLPLLRTLRTGLHHRTRIFRAPGPPSPTRSEPAGSR